DGSFAQLLNGKDGADGKDGKDGINGTNGVDGKDGKDGYVPSIAIKKDVDGIYYWTCDGAFLLDETGSKVPAQGKDGTNGKDGINGTNGVNGTNGTNGITPEFKIDGGLWYVSYDNNITWIELGQATGDKGEKGDTGAKGDKGDAGANGTNGSKGDNGITPKLKIEDGYWYVSYDGGKTWEKDPLGKATADVDDKETSSANNIDGHEYVDLGLPSGTKWATMNVGASKPEDYGDYYAWGEIFPPTTNNYSPANCNLYYKTSSELKTKGMLDANGNLTSEYDVAVQNWSENWRMPTSEECKELIDNCTWTLATINGVKGYKIASRKVGNTNWIFLPAAGYHNGTTCYDEGLRGNYWSSSVDESSNYDSYFLIFSSKLASNHRYYGNSVRPVVNEKPLNTSISLDGHEYVDLGLPSGTKWATMNVGASKPEDYGTYFSWGEIAPALNNDYSYYNCNFAEESASTLLKNSVVDANGNLTASYDAVTQNWSKSWRMPTKDEFDELIMKCTWTSLSIGGVNGYKITSKQAGNTNWIFLPTTGYRKGTSTLEVTSGFYWSSTVHDKYLNQAYGLSFASSKNTAYMGRSGGQPIRPVVKE
ncbi:MAG: DUF4988 domain-containing protein, partial [Paludibacteraceae bacterium]|nr:DUF4988 domain-containing protein [Paludibacteraceae bacterium]